MNDKTQFYLAASEAANKMAAAFVELGGTLAAAVLPIVEAWNAFDRTPKKRELYLRRYHRRGERMKKGR
jgi:hypothetical protein